ncbi:MAG TPA: tetratricopeptide repeat protein [Gemmataceae bacterium]|nr:tetratricopeptide repeat protein [Gemmataceae bacterium]
MMLARCTATLLFLVFFAVSPLWADRRDAGPTKTDRRDAGPTKSKLPAKMPMTKLAPSKLVPDLCLVRYRISTTSPECQAHFDQALGYLYSYVWMEAARSFETALQYDPECPLAWWGLSRALELWGKKNHTEALLKASKLQDRASHREQLLILARMQEKGQASGSGDSEARKRKAIATLDDLIALYDDDEEAWCYRARMAAGGEMHGGKTASVPFYKALLRINPLHPSANHELLHYYESSRRPALGWIHAENYIKSSQGLPHAFHMQAHLAMRIGKWAHTTDRSAHAVELERAYHKEMNVKPREDYQYNHHLDILMRSLIHDGRFAEARAIEKEERACGYKSWLTWFQLHLGERDWTAASKIVDEMRKANKKDKTTAAYYSALLYLKKGEPARALPEIEVLQHALRDHPKDKNLPFRVWETQGWYMCQTGDVDAGLKLLFRTVDKTKNDYSHHAWGQGADYMELWGIAALKCGRESVAEEAFLEALAHDAGSVRAALGMQVLCEQQGRDEEARRFADLARRCWKQAGSESFEAELASLRGERYANRRVESAPGRVPVLSR